MVRHALQRKFFQSSCIYANFALLSWCSAVIENDQNERIATQFEMREGQKLLHSTEVRHERILEMLRDEKFVAIRNLTDVLEVSVATVRRDLDELQSAGRLRRTHGGAVSITQAANDPANEDRAVSNLEEKGLIAEAAASMIAEDDTVLLDAGTTALEVAKKLAFRSGLTIISNGSDIVAELIRGQTKNVYCVGGQFAEINRSFRGPLAEQFIRQFNVDKLILNAASIDLDRGLILTGSPENASVQRAMMEVAAQTIVVADHSKLTRFSFSVAVKISEVGVIVTDPGAEAMIEEAPEQMRRKFLIAR